LDYVNTHRDVIEGCRRGERKAQFELYRLYAKAMYNTCLRMLRNESDAEDVLQNSFVDVFTHLDSFQHQSSIGAWIKRIVVNNCINFLKKRKLYFEELTSNHWQEIDAKEEDYSPEINYKVQNIQKAMAALPDGYRVVCTLYLIEGYDHKEIGSVLGISEATSKSQYSRAKKKLREKLLLLDKKG